LALKVLELQVEDHLTSSTVQRGGGIVGDVLHPPTPGRRQGRTSAAANNVAAVGSPCRIANAGDEQNQAAATAPRTTAIPSR